MKDIKVMDTLREMRKDVDYIMNSYYYSPILFFAEAVSLTRKEPGLSIQDIAMCFKKQFDTAELKSLVKELTN